MVWNRSIRLYSVRDQRGKYWLDNCTVWKKCAKRIHIQLYIHAY